MTLLSNHSLGIAVDIGTTTVGMALVERSTGAILAEIGFINPQKKYGSDVAGRIRFGSTKEGAKKLGLFIKSSLLNGVFALLKKSNQSFCDIDEIVISANTAMEYLFLERTTEKLGAYPFTMEHVGFQSISFSCVFQSVFEALEEKEEKLYQEIAKIQGIENDIPFLLEDIDFEQMKKIKQAQINVILLPCISTFVGADITSSLYHLGFPRKEGCYLLLDLGTNGEMAISGEKGFFTTSVPAGPAFEASLRGRGRKGSTLIQWIARARCRGQISADGSIAKRYKETGIPLEETLYLTQSVLRKLQLAKGAFMAGIEVLLQQYGVKPEEVKEVYLAGSFGFYLDVQSAILIGMLPSNWQSKIKIVGNTSLQGAIACLLDDKRQENLEKILHQVHSFNLAEMKEFQSLFLKHMEFQKIKIK